MKAVAVALFACLLLPAAAQAERILYDLGDPPYPTPPSNGLTWNNPAAPNGNLNEGWTILETGSVDANGNALAGVSIGCDNFYNINSTGVNADGAYPATAMRDSIYAYSDWATASKPASLVVWGLPGTAYDVKVTGSRDGSDSIRVGDYSVNGVTQQLNAAMNSNTVLTWAAVPVGAVTFTDYNGTIVTKANAIRIKVWPDQTGNYAYLGVVDLTAVSAPPANTAPAITMPVNVTISMPGAANAGAVALSAVVSDDGLPGATVCTWSKLSFSGTSTNAAVTFTNANAASTTACFSRVGTYTLQLDANDGALHTSATMMVMVQQDPRGDFDTNGTVDGMDFLAWQRNYNHGKAGSGAPIVDANFADADYAHAHGDADGNGKTDGSDFLIWQQDYTYEH